MSNLYKLVGSFISILCVVISLPAIGEPIRVGIIGLDTSHVIAFTRLMNDETHPDHVPGARVVAAYPGGSDDIASSFERLEGFTNQLKDDYGVEIVSTIEALCTKVDAILLESVDGRPHLEQVKPVFEAGLPVFIDKPLAGSLEDAVSIYRLGKKHDVPWFSSSSYRYYESMTELMQRDVGEIKGAISYGPAVIEPTHPDLFWYGVHPVEALFTALGPGCESVIRISTPDTDVVTGIWSGGKIGTLRGLRNAKTPHQVILFGSRDVASQQGGGNYAPLVGEIVEFFKTGVVPIEPEVTIEIFAFMEAADESKRRGGVPVMIEEVMTIAGGQGILD